VNRFKKPKRLMEGGTVAVVAPAGRVDHRLLQSGVARLEALGLKVILGQHLDKAHRYFAGSDRERAEDFQAVFLNPEVDAVFCARGGVGAARIIPFLDQKALAQSNKIFVGSSDITTLLIYLMQSFSWLTFHGPMIATHFGKEPSPPLESHLFRLLAGDCLEMQFERLKTLRSGRAEGILTGGCLTLLCTTIGTPYEIETAGRILFIEDVNEAPFRIDRMLSYLKSLGKFTHVRGVIFGQMPQCHPEALPEIILDIFGDSAFPILFSFPSGHGDATATLPLGASIRLDADLGLVKMLESAVL